MAFVAFNMKIDFISYYIYIVAPSAVFSDEIFAHPSAGNFYVVYFT